MASNTGNLAPYAPLANVIGLIRRRREKGLPEVLSTDKLIQMGIPEGNISRTLQALRFLNLIDEEGRQTAFFTRLASSKESEYPTALAEIIKSAYRDVFSILGDNLNDVTDVELGDAFRAYQPDAQRNRMIILFRGLCQEAGLIAGGPPETRMRARTTTASKPSSPQSNGAKRPQSSPKDAPLDTEPEHVSSSQVGQSATETLTISTEEYAIMHGVLNKLPFSEKKWTQAERTKWLKAVEAVVNMLFELEDPHTGAETEETLFNS